MDFTKKDGVILLGTCRDSYISSNMWNIYDDEHWWFFFLHVFPTWVLVFLHVFPHGNDSSRSWSILFLDSPKGRKHPAVGSLVSLVSQPREYCAITWYHGSHQARCHRVIATHWGGKESLYFRTWVESLWWIWFMVIHQNCLVVLGHPNLKNMSSSIGMISNPILMGKYKINVPNHQPEKIGCPKLQTFVRPRCHLAPGMISLRNSPQKSKYPSCWYPWLSTCYFSSSVLRFR